MFLLLRGMQRGPVTIWFVYIMLRYGGLVASLRIREVDLGSRHDARCSSSKMSASFNAAIIWCE